MSDTERRLSQMLHELVPEPPMDVSAQDVARGVRRRRAAAWSTGVVTAAVVAAAVAVPLALFGGGEAATVGEAPPSTQALTQTYTWGGLVSFDYPAGWHVRQFPYVTFGPGQPGPLLSNQVLDGSCWTNPQPACDVGNAVVHLQPGGVVAEWSVASLPGAAGFNGPVNLTVDGHPARLTSGVADRTCQQAGSAYTVLATIQTDTPNTYIEFRACYTAASLTPLLRDIVMSAQLPARNSVVPNALGLNVASATKELKQAGYVVQVTTVQSTQAPGVVLAQSPAAGVHEPTGATVVLRVSAEQS